MLANYGLIGLFFIVVVLFTLSMVIIPIVLRFLKIVPSNPNPIKSSIFECGMETIGKTWVQFNFRYYFFAILFVVLDVLTVFLYPWAVNLKGLGLFGLISVAVFFIILIVGYIYAWRKGALEWK